MQLKQRKLDCFRTDDETKEFLLYEMNNHLLMDEKPSEYFNSILESPIMKVHPFSMLSNLKNAEQSPVYHPEGNVWNHTMLVIDYAANEKRKSRNEKAFMWAALLHDIGKPDTTRNKKGRITSYDHEKVGAVLADEFLREFTTDEKFIRKVTSLIRWHMQILHVVKKNGFADIPGMKEGTDISEVALLGFCDRMGRKGSDIGKERQNIAVFLKNCRDCKA